MEKNNNRIPNHASFSIKGDQDHAEEEVFINSDKIEWLHAQTDQPGAEFDVVLYDKLNSEQVRRSFKGETDRYGEQVSLPIMDNYYIIKVENVKGAKKIDVFVE